MTADTESYLRAELQRLDLLLHRQILRLRAMYGLSIDEFRGLYISDEQVDQLIASSFTVDGVLTSPDDLWEAAERIRLETFASLDAGNPWIRLARQFELSSFEVDVLLLAMAPEVDLKYETIYAYLNNDVSRKWPTCDLALRLFSNHRSDRLDLRRHLLPGATLFACGLLQTVQATAERPSSLQTGFLVTPAVSQCLLGLEPQAPISAAVSCENPDTTWEEIPVSAERVIALRSVASFFGRARRESEAPILIFEGEYGSGRLTAARALGTELGLPLVRVDLTVARSSSEMLTSLMQSLVLNQRLRPSTIYLERTEICCDVEGRPALEACAILHYLETTHWPVILSTLPGTSWRELMRGRRSLIFPFTRSDTASRREMWKKQLTFARHTLSPSEFSTLAGRFDLTAGQIRDAVLAAMDTATLAAGEEAELDLQQLIVAARAQSDQGLGKLALKVTNTQSWDDLVLPPATLAQIHEVAGAIRHRHVVYDDWGFGRRIASGRGLKVLFAGASGTGKTMSAGVIAADLGLELYKIDLSGVVSKYIGETEKNLDRIFAAARSGNAILFFDEADALFGKRSEVKDAHDRYANIEVAYLLQKMEEHEGAVILASNLSKNIDNAFARRMHYVVEFPLPDETHRERLWRGMFPQEAPLSADVDFAFLAKQFAIAGGDIRNVALDAAFLAARDGQVIAMKQLVRATARQMLKQGRIPSPADFKHYHEWIMPDG
jgi:AAA+ superfamily predicted ATPase